MQIKPYHPLFLLLFLLSFILIWAALIRSQEINETYTYNVAYAQPNVAGAQPSTAYAQPNVAGAQPSNDAASPGSIETVAKQEYTDVNPSHWAYAAISDLTARGIINGFPDGSYLPEQPLRYGEFIKLVLASQGSAPGQIRQDKQPHWALGYYILAMEAGYFTIHDISKLQLDQAIPRGVMALLISATLQREKREVQKDDTSGNLGKTLQANVSEIKGYDQIRSAIKDVTATTAYEYEIVESYATGILNGYENHTFQPAKGLTRAEAAVVIERLMKPEQRILPDSTILNETGKTTAAMQTHPIKTLISHQELSKIHSWSPITSYTIVQDAGTYAMALRESRFRSQMILDIRTMDSISFLQKESGTEKLLVRDDMTEGHSQYPSETGMTARYYSGNIEEVDYIAVSPPYEYGATEGILTLIANPFHQNVR